MPTALELPFDSDGVTTPRPAIISAQQAVAGGSFRPIQYLGSKLRLVHQIRELTKEVAPASSVFCDLFAGSHVVSHAMAQSHSVVSVDIQRYAHVIGKALLRSRDTVDLATLCERAQKQGARARLLDSLAPMLDAETVALDEARSGDATLLADLIDFGSLQIARLERGRATPSRVGFPLAETLRRLEACGGDALVATMYFGGAYFSYAQAFELDMLRNAIVELESEEARALATAALLSTASEIVNTVGKQFAQPIRLRTREGFAKPLLVGRALADRTKHVGKTFASWLERYLSHRHPSEQHEVVQADYSDFLSTHRRAVDIFYADPPYTIDHYSRFYHVLETLALGDSPQLAAMTKDGVRTVMRGIYRQDRHQSPFCIPSEVGPAFDRLFKGVARFHAPLILSYSPFVDGHGRPRLLSLEAISGLAQRHFAKVDVRSAAPHSHRKLNASKNNTAVDNNGEIFLICMPRET